jgi:sterol desaturase/sphingolipid hydroxylase (fatty acid hydroxylase superfamily)
MSDENRLEIRRASPSDSIAVGLVLVFFPIAILVAAFEWTGSALLAATAALSVSTTLQLAAEHWRPRGLLAPKRPKQLGVEIFQGVVYGTILGVGVAFGLWWLARGLRSALDIELVLGGGIWLQAVVLVVMADFLDYFRHRHEHMSDGIFWRVHSVHHSIRRFSLLDGLAIHPLETLFTYVWYGVLAGVLGMSFETMLLGFAIALIIMGAQHTNTGTSLGPLSFVFAHADGHRWHHDIGLESGRNVNYANVLSLWDVLWGTYYAPREFDGDYGIEPFRDAYPTGLFDQALLVLSERYAAAETSARARARSIVAGVNRGTNRSEES